MKTVDQAFLTQQQRLVGSKAVDEVIIYKRYQGAITEVVDVNNFKVEGDATALLAVDDWMIITTQKFNLKYRVSGTPTYSAGVTTIPSAGSTLGATDVGGYVGKKYDLSRQTLSIGNITQSFEGQTLNEFSAAAANVDFNDRLYTTLFDQPNATGVFYQDGWNGSLTLVAAAAGVTVLTLSVSGLVIDALKGYYFTFTSGYHEGLRVPILSNTATTVTVYGEFPFAAVGNIFTMKIENIFYLEYITGFKNAL